MVHVGVDLVLHAGVTLDLERGMGDAEPLDQHAFEVLGAQLGIVQRRSAAEHDMGGECRVLTAARPEV